MATQKRLQQRNERIVQKRMAEDYVSLQFFGLYSLQKPAKETHTWR